MKKYLRLKCLSLLFPVMLLVFSTLSPAQAEVSFIWPVEGKVLTYYQEKTHEGIDIEAPENTPVVAAGEGWVNCAQYVGSNGLTISIDHSDNLTTTYAHLSKTLVNKGDSVAADQTIGFTGTTGKLTLSNPHLHFGVYLTDSRKDKKYVHLDPLLLLPPLEVQPENPDSSSVSVPIGASVPTTPQPNPAQVPAEAEDAAPAGGAADSLSTPNSVPSGSPGTLANPPESEILQNTQRTENFSTSSGSTSNPASSNPSQPLLQGAEAESQDDLMELSPSSSPKLALANISSKNVRQGSSNSNSTNGNSYAETSTNPWQIALLSIAFSLVLFFMLKKKIVSFLSSHQILEPIFLKYRFL